MGSPQAVESVVVQGHVGSDSSPLGSTLGPSCPLGPLGFNFSQHGPTTHPSRRIGPIGFNVTQHMRPQPDKGVSSGRRDVHVGLPPIVL
jgi:hypothetical protein